MKCLQKGISSNRHLRVGIGLASIVLLLFLSSCSSPSVPDEETLKSLGMIPVTTDLETPDISFADADGVNHKLSDYVGSVIVLNFWASWCPPCRAEMPSMSRMNAALENGDFVFIPVNVQEPPELIESFAKEYDLDFPLYSDVLAEAAMEFGVTALPTTVLLDRKGKVVAIVQGVFEWDDDDFLKMMQEWTR